MALQGCLFLISGKVLFGQRAKCPLNLSAHPMFECLQSHMNLSGAAAAKLGLLKKEFAYSGIAVAVVELEVLFSGCTAVPRIFLLFESSASLSQGVY